MRLSCVDCFSLDIGIGLHGLCVANLHAAKKRVQFGALEKNHAAAQAYGLRAAGSAHAPIEGSTAHVVARCGGGWAKEFFFHVAHGRHLSPNGETL